MYITTVFTNIAIWKYNITLKAMNDACIFHIKGTIIFFGILRRWRKDFWLFRQFRHQPYTMKSQIRTYIVTALHECQAIFHMLDLYSTNQVLFLHNRLYTIPCHFLVNNLHCITYYYHIIQSLNKFHKELNTTVSEFSLRLSHVLTFLTSQIHF